MPFASSRTGGFSALVLWPEGAMPDLATLQASRRVALGGVELPTRWREDGAPYQRFDADGNLLGTSLRITYADFLATIAGAGTTPTEPSAILEVVAADNSSTPAPTFSSWFAGVRVWIGYTDVNAVLGNTVVGPIDVAARARLSIPGSSWEERIEGGRRVAEFSCYIGPGRHARGIRSLGHNNSGDTSTPPNPPVWIDGLTHVRGTLEQVHGNAWATLKCLVLRDAPYPYPSAPPDGGARAQFDPARPTFLNPLAPANAYMLASWNGVLPRPEREELERPRALTCSNFSITVDHASAALRWRPWWVRNHATGEGPATTLPTSGNTTTVPELIGIGDGEAFAFAGTLADAAALSDAQTEEIAADPHVYTPTPTLAHQRAQTHRRSFTRGAAAGANGNIRGPWLPVRNIAETKLRTWLARRNTLGFLARTYANPWHSWAPREGHANWPYETTPTGANQGGVHYVVGWNGYGEATLAGSGAHLYAHHFWSFRWFTARGGHLHPQAFEGLDLVSLTAGREPYSACWEGTAVLGTSRLGFGRRQYGGGNLAPAAWWNGAPDSGVNPDPRGRWERAKRTHHTTPPLYWVGLLTGCPMARYLLRSHAYMAACGTPSRFYPSDQNPRNQTTRAEARQGDVLFHYWQLERRAALRARIYNHVIARFASFLVPGHGVSWRHVGGANDDRDIEAATCGIPPYSGTPLRSNQYLFWQVSQAAWTLVRWAWEAPTRQAEAILDAVYYMVRATVEDGFVCDPARLSAAAQRPGDSCWAGLLAHIVATQGPNSPGIPREGVLQTKSKRTVPTIDTPAPPSFEAIYRDVDRSNGGQNQQTIPTLQLFRFFPGLRLDPGLAERHAFVLAAYESIAPQAFNGDEYVSDLGFGVDELHDDGGPVIPPPRAEITVQPTSGGVGLEVEIRADGSTFGGPSSGVTLKFWKNYDPSNPSPADFAIAWDVATRYRATYQTTGRFYPAVQLTQEDGRADLKRSSVPVLIDTVIVLEPPRAGLTVAPPDGVAPFTPTLDAATSSFTGAASSTTLEFWKHYDPSSPSLPDQTQLWSSGTTWSPTYTAGGVYSPALRITQPDGQSAFLLLTEAVLVVEVPVSPSFTVSSRNGSAPFTPTLDAAASTFGGPGTAATLRWWKDYNPVNPGTPDLVQLWSVGTTFAPTYNVGGFFRPALEIEQQDGRRGFVRDELGIRVDVLAPIDSPVVAVSIVPRSGTVGLATLIDAGASTYFGPASAAIFRFWRHFDPQAPTPPDLTIAASVATSYLAIYDAAGLFFPAVELEQQDGQRDFFRDRIGVRVGNPPSDPPRPSFSVSARTGDIPASIIFNAAASTFSGPSAVLAWFKHYSLTAPNTPDAVTPWAESATYTAVYSTGGVFFPALLLTDAEGRSALYRDPLGIAVSVLTTPDPPQPDFDSVGPRVNLRPGSTALLFYTGLGPTATSWAWYWRGASGVLHFFSAERDPLLQIPEGETSIAVRCEAANEFGDAFEEKVAWITIATEDLPVAGFELELYTFDEELPDWPAPYALVAANWGTEEAAHYFDIEPGGHYEGRRPLDMLLLGPGDFVVTQTVVNSAGIATARRRVTVLTGEEHRGSFDPRGELLAGDFDPHTEGLSGAFDVSVEPLE